MRRMYMTYTRRLCSREGSWRVRRLSDMLYSGLILDFGGVVATDFYGANLPAARELGLGTLFFTGADDEVAEIERLIGIA